MGQPETIGQLGDYGISTTSKLPLKINIQNAIKITVGNGHIGILTADGISWSCGKNTNGQLRKQFKNKCNISSKSWKQNNRPFLSEEIIL